MTQRMTPARNRYLRNLVSSGISGDIDVCDLGDALDELEATREHKKQLEGYLRAAHSALKQKDGLLCEGIKREERLWAELEQAKAAVEDLEAALHKYGHHQERCPARRPAPRSWHDGCECGLHAALGGA